MSRIAPATRIRLVEAISGLQRLRREMARLSHVDENYDGKKRALQAVIQKLQKSLSAGGS